ncbi:discoidin domain-containing protein [Exilibacterium tricleocarpae]|uniref:Discoidin domain-containing protein n=1 Tax=Exilibacterium tricleocarpae TaxID=2591008 RepID=A0A545T0J9_9GAMM|nr:discoidin domain-containing protein [Exilibacterium tricleocarpae]TQV70721.1 discoidin domain-containing protein [Exilibacterium tricleocarpae]
MTSVRSEVRARSKPGKMWSRGVLAGLYLGAALPAIAKATETEVADNTVGAASAAPVYAGAGEQTPAKAQYFSWINNTNEGATAAQTLENLAFFAWLKQEYGLQLDIYAFDAGTIDGKRWYGSTASERFRQHFPNGFDPVYRKAKELGIRLGVWGGPDGFGNTPAQEHERIRMMVELCDRYNFALFKFDSVAGQLRDEKQQAFARMMTLCRQVAPDLILLNHRLNLGEVGTPHATTFLWEGQETYIDVHLANQQPAPHHRAAALARGLPPNLSRLTEDHGVCFSASLDYWDDELVLQAFNRALILSPQIYCNPWLLRDDEYPKLARLFNLARKYRDILVHGKVLPQRRYGPFAVARGDGQTRLLTLRNLSWQPVTYTLRLSDEIGLERPAPASSYEVRRLHPGERVVGEFSYGAKVPVTVAPFRSALVRVTTNRDLAVLGTDYDVVKHVSGQPVEILLTGNPGEVARVSLTGTRGFKSAQLDGLDAGELLQGNEREVVFPGTTLNEATHRRLGRLRRTALPADAESLYETSVFSSDNNALEVRALQRSGPSNIAAVNAAREAFFQQPTFIKRGVWDRNLFDGDSRTAFFRMQRWSYLWNVDPDATVNGGALRLDMGTVENIDSLILESRDEASIQPLKVGEGIIAEVSEDLKSWTEVRFVAAPTMKIAMPSKGFPVRYLRMAEAPAWLSEVSAVRNNRVLPRSHWRASNLFGHFQNMDFSQAWHKTIVLNEIAPAAYLAVTVPGEVGNESVYAGMRVDGRAVGAADRAPAYPANTWELQIKPVTGNYTYYIPLDRSWATKRLDVFLLANGRVKNLKPEIWLTRRPQPLATRKLVLE